MKQSPIRVALVDDHLILLEALAARIGAQPDMTVVATATNADEGLRAILETQPDVAVMDVELPERGSFEIAAEIRSRGNQTRLLFLTGFLSDVFIEQALRLKAHGYLMKGEPVETLFEGIRKVALGDYCFSKEVEDRLDYDRVRKRYLLSRTHPLSVLTTRQLEVLRHLAKGESVKQVAKMLHLSEKSVDSHKYRIMHKLGIHDRVQLARYAIREGLLLP